MGVLQGPGIIDGIVPDQVIWKMLTPIVIPLAIYWP
jgi:hypothetical protein